jgi:hypothetical protein
VTTDVPEIAHDLYAEPPESFVASRNALAKRLKADGDDVTSAIVAKLRRPTVAAVAVNLATRARGDLVHALLETGPRLAAAQRQLMSGKAAAAEELRTAGEERRRLVRELVAAAIDAAAAEDRSVDHLRDEIAGTFEAATLDETLGARLREGTIERSEIPSAGLTGVEGFSVIPGGADPVAGDADVGDDAPTRTRRAADEAAKEARDARAEADTAAKAAGRAAEKAERLARAADDAERAAREARSEERRLRDEATTARRRAERAERSAKAAAERAER